MKKTKCPKCNKENTNAILLECSATHITETCKNVIGFKKSIWNYLFFTDASKPIFCNFIGWMDFENKDKWIKIK